MWTTLAKMLGLVLVGGLVFSAFGKIGEPAARGAKEWREHYGAQAGAAEAQADRTIHFMARGNPVNWGKVEAGRSGSGRINGLPVICSRFRPGAASKRNPGFERVLVIGPDMIADAPHWNETFTVLWRIGGCAN